MQASPHGHTSHVGRMLYVIVHVSATCPRSASYFLITSTCPTSIAWATFDVRVMRRAISGRVTVQLSVPILNSRGTTNESCFAVGVCARPDDSAAAFLDELRDEFGNAALR